VVEVLPRFLRLRRRLLVVVVVALLLVEVAVLPLSLEARPR
jgi:hypothetical protein